MNTMSGERRKGWKIPDPFSSEKPRFAAKVRKGVLLHRVNRNGRPNFKVGLGRAPYATLAMLMYVYTTWAGRSLDRST